MRLVLVRHGDAAAGWDEDADPGLSDLGARQARAVANELGPRGALPIVTSPLRRCQETAQPLAAHWGVVPTLEPSVGEIQAPDHDVATRGPWLATVLGQRWPDLPRDQQSWRDGVIACLLARSTDTIVFTHFVAINVAIGAATGDDRVVCRRVANCSTTVLDSDGTSLTLVDAPAEAVHTEVL